MSCAEHILTMHKQAETEKQLEAMTAAIKVLEKNDIEARRDKLWIVGLLGPVMAFVTHFLIRFLDGAK